MAPWARSRSSGLVPWPGAAVSSQINPAALTALVCLGAANHDIHMEFATVWEAEAPCPSAYGHRLADGLGRGPRGATGPLLDIPSAARDD